MKDERAISSDEAIMQKNTHDSASSCSACIWERSRIKDTVFFPDINKLTRGKWSAHLPEGLPDEV
ncbi:MAG: hypothetical protein V8T00_04760 [Oscillospiraceae bacterium]